MAGLQNEPLPPPPRLGGEPAGRLTPPTEIMKRRRERERLAREAKAQERQQDPSREPARNPEQVPEPRRRPDAIAAGDANNDLQPTQIPSRRQPFEPLPTNSHRRNQSANVSEPTSRIPIGTRDSGADTRRRSSNPPPEPQRQSKIPSAREEKQAREERNTAQSAPLGGSTVPGPPTNPSRTQRPTESQPKKQGSSFPHAFERWETLSSHWEGLTGYWIKRLQNNADELNGQPLNQQLARQVTDLSAAGANLFHAVVELQRLRASSERKFQRWFFETRADQEKQTEEIAKLKTALRDSRAEPRAEPREQPPAVSREQQEREQQRYREMQDRLSLELRQADDRIRVAEKAAAQQVENMRLESTKQLNEMRRELQISRDEARRGWEEIGRMEQGERDRMFSLKRGEPTMVGNISVVPRAMIPATSSRPTTREGGLSSHPVQPEDFHHGNYGVDARSETDTDPFTESGGRNTASTRIAGLMPTSQPQTTYATSAAAVDASVRAFSASPQRVALSTGAASASPRSQPSAPHAPYPPRSESYAASRPGPTSAPGSAGFYQQHQPILHQQPGQTHPTVLQADEVRSHGTVSEDDYGYDQQNVRAQPAGYQQDRLRSPSELSDDYGTALPPGTGYAATTSNGNVRPVNAPDYSGQGYGSSSEEWGNITGSRHHHPTRLSDIVEEASRTSPSRASERSHPFR